MPSFISRNSRKVRAEKVAREGLEKGARKYYQVWVELENTKKKNKKIPPKRAIELKTRIDSSFNTIVNHITLQFAYEDLVLSLLFFIEKQFGIKFKREENNNYQGYLYGETYTKWCKKSSINFLPAYWYEELNTKCIHFTTSEVPIRNKQQILGRIWGQEFIPRPQVVDLPRQKPDSHLANKRALSPKEFSQKEDAVARRLGSLSADDRKLSPDEFFRATADFPDEDPGLINFSICRTDECTLKATKDDYKRFERTLESKSGHRLMYDRLELVFQLNPTRRYWGRNAYQGYTALEFYDCPKVLLTSPIYGNAVYILRKDEWRNLTNNYVKEEIRSKFPKQSTTFPHTDGWLHKVSRELKRENFS